MSNLQQNFSCEFYRKVQSRACRTALATLTLVIGSWVSQAAAEVLPGQDLEPLDFNATFISDIAESRVGSGGLSDILGQIGGKILKEQLPSNATCTRATVQSVSKREVKVEIECDAPDGTQMTVAAYSDTDKPTPNVANTKVLLRGGQAEATLAIPSSAGLTMSVKSKFLIVNQGNARKLELSGSKTSLFSMVHDFAQGSKVRPEPETSNNFRAFGASVQKIRKARPTTPRPSTTSNSAKAPTFNRNPVRKKQIISDGTLFQQPVYEGKYPVSFCQSSGRACGKKAADAFCRREGYAEASSFSERTNVATLTKPAIALSDGSFCPTSTCKVLSNVGCLKVGPNTNIIGLHDRKVRDRQIYDESTYTYTRPHSSGYRVDSCLNWGKECGKPAADAFCKIKGFAASKTHTLAMDVASATSPTLVLNSGQTCANGNCDSFEKIQCTNEAPPLNIIFTPSMISTALMLTYAAPGDSGPSLDNAFSFAYIDTGGVRDVNTDAALPFHHEVWRDSIDESVYYYAPRQFNLSYGQTNDGKLGINALYGNDSSAEKPITLTLEFDTGIDEADVKDLHSLIKKTLAAETGTAPDFELKRFPVLADPAVTFELFPGSGEPRVLSLDNNRFSTLSLQWSLSEAVWQGWQVSLRDQNHSGGTMTLTSPDADNPLKHQITILAKAADPSVYGQDIPKELKSWTNNTPFTVTLNRLNGLGQLRKKPSSVSWSLQDTKLMPGEQVIFETDSRNFPDNLKRNMVKYWLDYRLDTTCQNCVDKALPTQSVSSALGRNISFKLPASYDSSGYEEVQIVVRSRYFTPQARREDMSPMIALNAPGQEETIASPLYLPDGRQLSEGGLAEAMITVVTSGGERTVPGPWFDITNERTFISPSKIQSILDAIP